MKMLIYVNNELKMGKGKIAAQVGHAVQKAIEMTDKETLHKWNEDMYTKIVLQCTENKLIETAFRFANREIPFFIVHDAGRTQIEPDSITALGVIPLENDVAEHFSKGFKLL